MSSLKCLSDAAVDDLIKSIESIKTIRNETMKKYGIDILDNDKVSLSTFFSIIRRVDSNYRCNYSRNGNDGYTILNGQTVGVESKTTKLKRSKKGKYGKTTFAFHAKGLINYDAYLFNVWDKDTLNPIRSYYIRSSKSVKVINSELEKLSKEWQSKPSTKAGYDVIRIHENMLEKLATSIDVVDGCTIYHL